MQLKKIYILVKKQLIWGYPLQSAYHVHIMLLNNEYISINASINNGKVTKTFKKLIN